VEGVTGERHGNFVNRLPVDPAERKKAEKEKKKKLRSAERKKAVGEAPVGVGSG
jgi:hypothetical protein